MSSAATEAAEELAAVLKAESVNLASDDLTTISSAMTAVRAAARKLEGSLTARGWGGGVLYGLGQPLEDEHGDQPDDSGDEDEDDDEPDTDEDGPWVVPSGTRMTYQARFDFFVVDDGALLSYVERRATEQGPSWDRQAILDYGPLFVLTYLDGFGHKDIEGIVFAGAQEAIHDVPVTLYEMDSDAEGDQFPTNV